MENYEGQFSSDLETEVEFDGNDSSLGEMIVSEIQVKDYFLWENMDNYVGQREVFLMFANAKIKQKMWVRLWSALNYFLVVIWSNISGNIFHFDHF